MSLLPFNRIKLPPAPPAPSQRPCAWRVGLCLPGLGADPPLAMLSAMFPAVTFRGLDTPWPERAAQTFDLLIVGLDAADPAGIDRLTTRLSTCVGRVEVLVVMRDADVELTRRLIHQGAADVLPAPVTDTALAIALERIFCRLDTGRAQRRSGEIVTLLKAGGGVGATSLAVQTAVRLAANPAAAGVCVADLDLQMGAAALYLDIPDPVTVAQVLATGGAVEEMAFASVLTAHRSGVSVLAAPGELMPVESLNPALIDGLTAALRRDFEITLVDPPTVWTAWTNRLLRQSQRIVLVTRLSVPHVHMVRRQLHMLSAQRLDDVPVTLVCNQVEPDGAGGLSLKAAQQAIGRPFDLVIPEDRRLMHQAIDQGVSLAAVRRGSKIEAAIDRLAEMVAPTRVAAAVGTER
jgi:pilus assembly protein CpaE